MRWSNLFVQASEISAEAARDFIQDREPDNFQLVDVRQPKEYQEQHIPGAILIPLGELKDRVGELSPDTPTIVYCRSGARSKAGCEILMDNNFAEVHNLAGGIIRWNGATAFGGEEFGVDFFIQGKYANGYEMAFYLEKGLQKFYTILAEQAQDEGVAKLLTKMAQMEDGHMKALTVKAGEAGEELDTSKDDPAFIEGGLSFAQLQTAFGDNVKTPQTVIQLAMMFEAQACDLYSRLARKNAGPTEGSFYRQMAAEEQKHLDKLTSELDNLL